MDGRVEEYITGGCRRRAIDQYLDGTVDRYIRQQCEEGEAMCDQYTSRYTASDLARHLASDSANHSVRHSTSQPTSDPARHFAISPNAKPPTSRYTRAISPSPIPPMAKRRKSPIFPSTVHYQAPVQRQSQQAEADGQEIKSIQEQFDRWAGQCRLCGMIQHAANHKMEDCPHPQAPIAQLWID